MEQLNYIKLRYKYLQSQIIKFICAMVDILMNPDNCKQRHTQGKFGVYILPLSFL